LYRAEKKNSTMMVFYNLFIKQWKTEMAMYATTTLFFIAH
jgi:hypothetical protein